MCLTTGLVVGGFGEGAQLFLSSSKHRLDDVAGLCWTQSSFLWVFTPQCSNQCFCRSFPLLLLQASLCPTSLIWQSNLATASSQTLWGVLCSDLHTSSLLSTDVCNHYSSHLDCCSVNTLLPTASRKTLVNLHFTVPKHLFTVCTWCPWRSTPLQPHRVCRCRHQTDRSWLDVIVFYLLDGCGYWLARYLCRCLQRWFYYVFDSLKDLQSNGSCLKPAALPTCESPTFSSSFLSVKPPNDTYTDIKTQHYSW